MCSKSLSWCSKKPILKTGITNEIVIDDISFYAASKIVKNDHDNDHDTEQKFIELVKSILQTRVDEEIFIKALVLFDRE